MAISFSCSTCGKKLSAPEKRAGMRARCPRCEEPVVVPAPLVRKAKPAPLAQKAKPAASEAEIAGWLLEPEANEKPRPVESEQAIEPARRRAAPPRSLPPPESDDEPTPTLARTPPMREKDLPGAKRGIAAIVMLAISMVAAAFALFIFLTGDLDAIVGFTVAVEFPLVLATGVVFLIWFYNAHANLRLLGARNLVYSPGWAVGCFFVPFVNLTRPAQIAQEIWRGSDPDEPDGAAQASSGIVNAWWCCWLGSGLAGQVANHLFTNRDRDAGRLMFFISDLLVLAAGMFAIMMIRQIRARQELCWSRVQSR